MQVEAVKATSGKTCTVLCKLPNGLHLDLPGEAGVVRRVSVRGTNAGAVDPASGDQLFPGRRAVGGYGITSNVDEAFFEEWLKRNQALQLVREGKILKAKDVGSAISIGRERAKEENKLEPIDPSKPIKGLEKVTPFKEYADA